MNVREVGILIKDLYYVLMKNDLGNVKECRTLIHHHHVKVNDVVILDHCYQVNENDEIYVDEQKIDAHPFVYYMMNKPKNYICANKDKHHLCVCDLIEKDCFCIGRLDKDTTGLLFLSNDQSFLKKLLLPQYHVQKIYEVTVLYPLDKGLIELFHDGIIIDNHKKCDSALLEIIDDYHCLVTIHEGKYHQVKKMFLSCHNMVLDLKRVSFAGIKLDESLKLGEYRSLNSLEFQKLKEVLKAKR